MEEYIEVTCGHFCLRREEDPANRGLVEGLRDYDLKSGTLFLWLCFISRKMPLFTDFFSLIEIFYRNNEDQFLGEGRPRTGDG
jgi:hypothetical protein